MFNQLLLFCSIIIIYEYIKYINLIKILYLNLKIYQKLISLFRYKNVSDFRKEKLILNYSKSLLTTSIKIFIIIISIFIFIILLNLLSKSYINLVVSYLGIFEVSIGFIIYHFIRKKFYAKL